MQLTAWGSISNQGVVIHITGGNFAQTATAIGKNFIESIVGAHNKFKVAPATQPRALSMVQERAVRVAHYLIGGIATTWAFFLARLISVG
ncbi:hypothetical protein AMTR_s00023p00250910 [Amborella trichopoda]|uniref:Uncharacterized protein n=1 Tax=Amborella trichopoda TaxID=13333 RepID=W1NJT6_AMBTC|nr:hypothetical protein AMTR_s00023p00250910 [Amborella trichopoda]